jgi:transcriptional regulator with XRE-family HTH domain
MMTSRHVRIMKIFGTRLKQAREAAGYDSAAKAAAQLGIEAPTYRAYERGDREANYETLLRMCELYGISVDYVLPVQAPVGNAAKTRRPAA